MSDYKLAIFAADAGSRLDDSDGEANPAGSRGAGIDKGFLPLRHKAIISHIIDKFPDDIGIIVILSSGNGLLKEYLSIAHPGRNFTYVEADAGGAGWSLLPAKNYLQCPFVLSAADAVVFEHIIPRPTVNWLGVSPVDDVARFHSANPGAACLHPRLSGAGVKIRDGFVADIQRKTRRDNTHAAIGLSGIRDYELFWRTLEDERTLAGEPQLFGGLNALMKSPGKLCAVEFTWFDAGTGEGYEAAKRAFDKNRDDFDFSRTGERAYFAGDRVITYIEDAERAALLVRRANILEGFVPRIDEKSAHFISYKKIPGRAMHEEMDDGRARDFFAWLRDSFWNKENPPDFEKKKFSGVCRNFYKETTASRVSDYWRTAGRNDGPSVVNGNRIPSLAELLEKIDWEWIADGAPSRFHGDMKFDNILATDDVRQPFVLLDYETDFAGIADYGDRYYDLAALYGDMIAPRHLVKKNGFSFEEENGGVFFDIPSSYSLSSALSLYEKFLSDEGYDLDKVKLLAALLFLHASPLQKEPLNFLLHHLAKLELARLFDKRA